MALAAVLALASLVYLGRLGDVPVYLGWDEARFALQGHAIATTGRDLNGHRLPLFFHNTDPLIPNHSSRIWWQPFLIYLTAAVLRVLPLAEASVRLPVALLAVLNVALIYAVARRLFAPPWYAVLAALLLALDPAHVLFGRQASDYFCPQTFALAWLWCLLRCVQTDRRWTAAVIGFVLGLGLFSYISSWLVMPAYLGVSAVVLWLARKPLRDFLALGAGFAVMLIPLVPWLYLHPTTVRDTFQGYNVATDLRVVERVTLYWDYFNPSYLFFSGGSDPMWATRRAGVFLLASAVMLPCGLLALGRRGWQAPHAVVPFGFFFAPVPIVAALPEAPQAATARALLAIPFGVLISVAGVQWLLATRRRLAVLLVALLIASVPIQFASFARDYLGEYQARSSFRFDSANLRDVAAYVIAADAASPLPAIYLSDTLGTGKSVQWRFHLTKHQRLDLWGRTHYFTIDRFNPAEIPPASLLVLDVNNPLMEQLVGPDRCAIVHVVTDVTGSPVTAILRRHE